MDIRTLLIVDDDFGFRRALVRFAQKCGFDAVEAASANDALEIAAAAQPDIIIVDHCLDPLRPNDTSAAEELIRRIKGSAATAGIPVVSVSGLKPDAETQARMKLCGAVECFEKIEIFDHRGEPFVRRIRAAVLLERENRVEPVEPEVPSSTTWSSRLPMRPVVLVIDDDEEAAALFSVLLKGECTVIAARSGLEGLRLAARELPDLVVLDFNLPDQKGDEICRRLREAGSPHNLPILILTGDERAKEAGLDRQIRCLEVGADDYLVKGCATKLLLAKIRNLILRRRFGLNSRAELRIGRVGLNARTHELTLGSKKISLTDKECAILSILLSANGQPIDGRTLHKRLYRSWPGPEQMSRIKKHVSNLRQKLGELSHLIVAVRNSGYRIDIDLARSLTGDF